MTDELKRIKKKYGEEMMHLCRSLFSTLLEEENALYNILINNIAPTKLLYNDLVKNDLVDDFKKYILSFVNKDSDEELSNSDLNPYELMQKAGYKLYKCETKKDTLKFRKYYEPDEELCTFNEDRTLKCYVFFAVKKGADRINREDFDSPQRQDDYGTSVISIQFSKGDINTLSIKNRYNHTVKKPDSTFSNNLENIIPGLTNSFSKYFNLNISQNLEPSSKFLTDDLTYVRANDGRYYRYNYEFYNTYYCENNIIIDNGNIIDDIKIKKERYIIMDYFILDLKEKKLSKYPTLHYLDTFPDVFNKDVSKIEVISNSKEKIIKKYYPNDDKNVLKDKILTIVLNEANQIIALYDDNITSLPDYFLYCNVHLKGLYMQGVKSINHNVLVYNRNLVNLYLPHVKEIGDNFLSQDSMLMHLNLNRVEVIGNKVFYFVRYLRKLNMPNVKIIGDDFLYNNEDMDIITCPQLVTLGSDFLYYNLFIEDMCFPNLLNVGDNFLVHNLNLRNLSLPKLEYTGKNFLKTNARLKELNVPSLNKIEPGFLSYNTDLKPKSLYIGNVCDIPENCFLRNNPVRRKIEKISRGNRGKTLIKSKW